MDCINNKRNLKKKMKVVNRVKSGPLLIATIRMKLAGGCPRTEKIASKFTKAKR